MGRVTRLGLILTAVLLLSACKADLYTGLNEEDANEMVATLMDGGLSGFKIRSKDGGNTVVIEQAQFGAAVELLKTHGLPRAKFATINDVFQPSGLIASPTQEQARYLWALSQELSKTISQIDGVLTARVQVVLPDNDLMKRAATPSSASVFIRYDEGSQASGLVSQIKALIASSVQGLSYDKVSVTLVPVSRVASRPAATSAAEDWRLPAGAGAAVALLLVGIAWAFRGVAGKFRDRTRPPSTEPAE